MDSRSAEVVPVFGAVGAERVIPQPKALDLFCGAGGASMGLHRAGFDVTGVDIKPQPRYPFRFVQADALQPPFDLRQFDFIWASPPCQAHSTMKSMHNARKHDDLIPAIRGILMESGVHWCIETVEGAPLQLVPRCQHGQRSVVGVYGGHLRNRKRVRTIGVYGEGVRDSVRKTDKGVPDFNVNQGRKAMGIDWMTIAELCQAIPPAYSEWIGQRIFEAHQKGA